MKTLDEIQAWIDKHAPDADEHALAWFIAMQEAEFACEWKQDDIAYLYFDGISAIKDNRGIQQEWLDTYNRIIQEDIDAGCDPSDFAGNLEASLRHHFGVKKMPEGVTAPGRK
jgi:hypothetical protein